CCERSHALARHFLDRIGLEGVVSARPDVGKTCRDGLVLFCADGLNIVTIFAEGCKGGSTVGGAKAFLERGGKGQNVGGSLVMMLIKGASVLLINGIVGFCAHRICVLAYILEHGRSHGDALVQLADLWLECVPPDCRHAVSTRFNPDKYFF